LIRRTATLKEALMSDDKFMYDSLQDTQSITEFIATLREGFEKGRITLSTNGDEIALAPRGLLNFTVKARRKSDGASKISIKIAWKESRDGAISACASPLRIDS
jgi:amphi-Trp domain-containing protein